MGLTRHLDLVKMEGALLQLIPREDWTLVSHLQIAYGRKGSNARTAKRKVVPPTGRFKKPFTGKGTHPKNSTNKKGWKLADFSPS